MALERALPASVLFVTLDSCRYDTFEAAAAPALKSIGQLYRAHAPSYFTFGSHMAMFAGFTPGMASLREPYVNPKFGKIFKLAGGGSTPPGGAFFSLQGENLIQGFKRRGYRAIGTAAVGWFRPDTDAGRVLGRDFDDFFHPGNVWSLRRQVEWLEERLREHAGRPVLAFVNVGETHVPYYHDGASWSREDNPCVPFSDANDAEKCRVRQRACLEFVDAALAPVLESFAGASTVVCGDHGDCWGEDGLWEHGVHHECTLAVPLLFRLSPEAGPDKESALATLGRRVARRLRK
jgi:hypothetical protein